MYQFTNTAPDFWIQIKGENAGQPLRKSIPNATGIKENQGLLDPDFLFYIVLYKYQTDAFKPYIKGSVIPYIRLNHIRMVIDSHLLIFFKSQSASQLHKQIRRAAVLNQ